MINLDNLKIVKPFLTFSNLEVRPNTRRIIIHHTAVKGDLSAKDIHLSHLKIGYAGIGYHFVIRKNGSIERGRPVWSIGAHAYGCNSNSIGVCLSGNFEIETPTTFQIESAALLIANLCNDFNILINRQNIKGHCEVDSTACPGKNIDLDTLAGKANWYFSH